MLGWDVAEGQGLSSPHSGLILQTPPSLKYPLWAVSTGKGRGLAPFIAGRLSSQVKGLALILSSVPGLGRTGVMGKR